MHNIENITQGNQIAITGEIFLEEIEVKKFTKPIVMAAVKARIIPLSSFIFQSVQDSVAVKIVPKRITPTIPI